METATSYVKTSNLKPHLEMTGSKPRTPSITRTSKGITATNTKTLASNSTKTLKTITPPNNPPREVVFFAFKQPLTIYLANGPDRDNPTEVIYPQ